MSRITSDLGRAIHYVHSGRGRQEERSLGELRRLFPFFKEHQGKIVSVLLLALVVSLLSMPGPFLIRYIIDEVVVARDSGRLNVIVGLLLLLTIAKVVVSFLSRYLSAVTSQEVTISLRQTLFSHILRFPMSFFGKKQTGYLVSRIREVDSLGILFSSGVVGLASGVFDLVFALGMMLYLSWQITLVALAVLPLFYIVLHRYAGSLRHINQDYMETGATVSRQYQEALSGISVVKSFAREDREKQKVEPSLHRLLQNGVDQSVIGSVATGLVALVASTGSFLVLWSSGRAIMGGTLTVGTYIALSMYLGTKLYPSMQTFATLGITLQPALAALHRISELLNMGTEEKPGKLHLSHLQGEIVFDRVSFSYDGGREVIQNVSFDIKPGEKVALVGPSGSGKSTLVNLLLGFYQPQKGSIVIDHKNLINLSLRDLRERIGIVSQNIFLFDDSIKNNIMYSRPDATEEEVVAAAKFAAAHDFIISMPQGYDTLVGERGFSLSGGQRQRVSIARSVLKDPDILIFDEATSELDTEAESKVKDMLAKVDCTCIVITHRLSFLDFVDKVVVLNEGRVVRSGSPGDLYPLIKEDGPFSFVKGG